MPRQKSEFKTLETKITPKRRAVLRELRSLRDVIRADGEKSSAGALTRMRHLLLFAQHDGMDHPEFPIVEELLDEYGHLLEKARA